jgi:ADP-L-glycero-D-manno-heptose 6-epimerase
MILVTGHRGFIGQNMAEALGPVVGFEWNPDDVDAFPDLNGISQVIHLGAISSTTCTDSKAIIRQNIGFTARLLMACDARRIPIQIASSASIYGQNNKTFREADAPDPQTLYARSKFVVEVFVQSRTWSIPVQLFRYFNVYGPHEDHKDQPSPHHSFRRQAKETGVIKVFEGSEQYARDFVPVDYVVDVHRRFFDLTVSGVYNVGTGTATSFMDVARQIALETGAEIQEVPMPAQIRKNYQPWTRADMTKTRSLLQV